MSHPASRWPVPVAVRRLPQARRRWRAFGALNLSIGLSHFLVLLNTGAYLPMIPKVAGSLGVPAALGDWTQTDFFLAMALAFPVAPWFLGRFGERDGLVSIFVVFAAASLVCGLTDDFTLFLIGRIVQGFAGGLSIPVSLGVLLRHYRPTARNVGLTLWGLAAITPFTLGPAVGGWLADHPGWRTLFLANVPLAIGPALVIAALVRGREEPYASVALDRIGLLLLGGGLFLLVLAFNRGEIESWFRVAWVWLPAVLGLLALAAFVVWEWRHPLPLIDLRLLRERNFAVGAAVLFGAAMTFQGAIAIYVIGFQLAMGYTASAVGALLLPFALFSKLSSVITHRGLRWIDPRWIGGLALLGFAAGCFWESSYDRLASWDQLMWPQAMVGLFLGMLFPAINALALSSVRPVDERQAATLLNSARVCGQAMGIPLVATFWGRRTQVFEHFLAQGDPAMAARLDQSLQPLFAAGLPHAARAVWIDRLFQHHASQIAFNEVFLLSGAIFVGLAALLLLARPRRHPGATAPMRRALEESIEF
jgi:drug resistance transporter, EmrB/QacA subfamily